jgi:hypothetical protein
MEGEKSRAGKLVAGLQLMMIHGPVDVDAQHDVIYAGGGDGEGLPDSLASSLEGLGWHWDDEYECWGFFT